MKQIITNFSQMSIGTLCLGMIMSIGIMMFSGCSKETLNIQESFSFDIKVMPVPKAIEWGQTVEIRIAVISSGDFTGNKYFLRYFQHDGQGSLRYYNNKPFLPNDLYPLEEREFRLYYTSESPVSQSFDIWISDSFGNEKMVSFQFNPIKSAPIKDGF